MRGGEGIMAAHQQQQHQHHHHHRPVAPLKVPPRPTPRSFSFSHSGFSPSPSFSSSRSPFVSPSPTPKPRPRPPEAPAWLTILLHTVPLYIAHTWLASHSSSSSSTTIVFAFLALLGSAVGFGVLQQQRQPWQGSSSSGGGGRSMTAPPAQWGLLLASGLLIAASTLLKLQGVRSCGPLVALLAEYAGSVLGKFVLGDWASSSPGRIRGLLATAIGLLLLAQGWTIESCSPLAIKERMNRSIKMPSGGKLPLWAPMAAGVLSACAKLMSTRTSLRWIPKKRVHGLSTICAAVLMLPLALLQLDNLALVQASAWWPLSSMILLGLAQSLRGDAHFEEKLLIPPSSPRHFAITCCCASLLELWFGLDISPLGFLACSALLALGVRDLADPGTALSLEAIAQHEAQASLWAMVKGPLRLITSDAKSGKIAAFLGMNAAFMVVEFAFGFTSNSLGLVSDACHMLFDCAALAIGLYASYISKLQPSSGFGYGYGRFEVLSGYANAVFLVLVASLIVLESIERILDPPEISTESLLLVSLGGLLVNLVGLVFFHEEHHHSHGGSCSSHSHDHSATIKQEELSINLLEDHGCCSSPQELSSSPATTRDSGHDSLAMEKQGFHQSHHSHSCTQHQHSDKQLKHRSCDHQHHQHSDHDHSDHQHSPDHHLHNSAHSRHHPDHQHSDHEQFSSSDHHDHEQCSSSHHHHPDHQHSPNHHDDSAHQHPDSAHSHQSDHHHHSPNQHENSAHQHHRHGNSAHSQHSCSDHHGHSLNHHRHAEDEHHHDHHDQHHETTTEDAHHHIDHNMRGIFLHVLADTLGSVGVVISTLLIKYKGWMFTDPACSIFISVMIIASVIPLLVNSGEILLQRTPRSTQKRLKEALEKIKHLQGVQGLERLHVWSFTNNEIVGTLHLHASTGTDKSMLRDRASRLLNNVGITDMTIQVEDM